MSARLSSTASKNLSTDKNALKSPLFLQDHNRDLAKHDLSADQSSGRGAVAPAGGRSDASSLDPSADLHPLRLLVVDESSQVRQMCYEVAGSFGFVGTEAETIPSALKIIERKETAVLVLDLTRTESEGQSLLAEIKSLSPNTLVIGMSSSATIASAVETIRAGACDYLSKPFPLHVLARAFERAAMRQCFDLERRKLQEAVNWRSGMGDALGQSVEMEKLYQMLSKVAGSRHPVTILGERGTGKELVAKAIHSNGPDSSGPFVSVDCTSMGSVSLEDTLFGGLNSALAKAGAQRRGLLSSLEGGTIFLDEIGSLTLDLQDRLARVLKEKKIRQMGGVSAHSLSVRILAASTLDLTQMVREGRFRMDLYRLLSLVNLKIPPLRGRQDDIAFLAERFLEKAGRATGTSRTLSKETLRALETYDWPENTQELEIAITQACTSSSGQKLEIDHLPQNILTFFHTKEAERKRDLSFRTKPTSGPREEHVIPISAVEKQAILKALQQTNGDKITAAKLLGIGKTTLYRKLKEYGVHIKPESSVSLSTSPPDSTSSPNVSGKPSHLVCA
jgi:DNA-binding NtrC family response regulator